MINKIAHLGLSIIKFILLSFILFIPVGYFLIGTQAGLHLDLYLVKKISGAKLTYKKAQGHLLTNITLQEVSYQSKNLDLTIKELSLDWSMIKSLSQGLSINNLQLKTISLISKVSEDLNKKSARQTKVGQLKVTDIKQLRTKLLSKLKTLNFNLKNINIENFKFKSANQTFLLKSLLIHAKSDRSKLTIQTFKALFQNESLTLKGHIDFDNYFNTDIKLESNGLVTLTSVVKGSLEHMIWQTNMTSPYRASALFKLTEQLEINGSINAKNIFWPLQGKPIFKLPFFALIINGTPKLYSIKTNGQYTHQKLPNQFFKMLAHGDTSSLTVNQFELTDGSSKISINGNINWLPNLHWQSQLTIDHLNSQRYFNTLGGIIHLKLSSTGEFNTKNKANGYLNIRLSPGYWSQNTKQNFHFQGGKLNIKKIKESIHAFGTLKIDANKQLSLSATLPSTNKKSIGEQKILGKINLKIDDIKIIDEFISDIKQSHGELEGQIYFSDQLNSPKLSLDLSLKDGQTTIPSRGLALKNINLNLKGSAKDYLLKGSLLSKQGLLNINGSATFHNSQFLTNLKLRGNNVNLLNTDEYKINASPTIDLNIQNKDITLSGDIKIDSADIKPHDFSSTIELPDDVIILGEDKEQNSAFNLAYQLNLDLGNKTEFSIAGLAGTLKGNVLLNAPLHQNFRATGSLDIVNGKYKAYGQNLTITQGKLIYAGGPLNNPGILFQASRSFTTNNQYSTSFNQGLNAQGNKITVGLRVKGRLKSPQSQLFSIPGTRSQSDILSMLILGKPISQASDEGSDSALSSSQLLITALTQLNLGNGSNGQQLTEQLKHAFGIDELNFEDQRHYDAESDTTTENTALVLGKSLSAKLSMHYSVGLAQGTNLLKIKYQFSPRWAIQTETSGNTNGVDIIYNYHK